MGKVNKLITCFMMYDKKVFHVTAAVERLRFFCRYCHRNTSLELYLHNHIFVAK